MRKRNILSLIYQPARLSVASVGKANSSSNEIQTLKSSYEMREAQKDHAHEEQIKKINASHQEEINRVVSESKEGMDKVRERSQNKFTDLEQKYQKEIENLKAMYLKKLAERES
jgi:DNA anti-recombination protein RmuC